MFFFAHPLMLIGLVSLAVPVIVHLFDLRRYRKVYFSNVDRLEALQRESRKESQLRRRLLLAVRLAALLFVVLAFAGPSLQRESDMLAPGETVVSVYIDNSFSMLQQSEKGQLLELARQKAAEIAAAYGPSDRFQLITNELSGDQFHLLYRDDFLTAVEGVTPSPCSMALSDIVRNQQHFMRNQHAANRHCYLISDFQRTTADMDHIADSLLTVGRYTFIPIHAATVDNIYLDSLSFDVPSLHVGSHATVSVHLRNTSDRLVEQVPLHLYVGGQRRAQTTTSIAPKSETVVAMHFVVDRAGAIEGCVTTVDSPVTFDDTLFFAFNVSRRLLVVELYGTSANPYLARLFDGDSTVAYSRTRSDEGVALLSSAALSDDYDCVVLSEIDRLPSALVHTLTDYVERGGTLIIVPSAHADLESYNQLLQPLQAPLLGDADSRPLQAVTLNDDAALFRGVFTSSVGSADLPRFQNAYRLTQHVATTSQNLLTLPDGRAALAVFYPPSQQPCYLFATPLRETHTDWVAQSLFVPTLYNMVLYSRTLQSPYYTLSNHAAPVEVPGTVAVGSTLRGIYNPSAPADGGERFECMPQITVSGGRSRMQLANLVDRAGCYRMGDADGELSLAFNYSRNESVMDYLADDELPQGDGRIATLSENQPVGLHIGRPHSLSHIFIWLALAMLLADVLLARPVLSRGAHRDT